MDYVVYSTLRRKVRNYVLCSVTMTLHGHSYTDEIGRYPTKQAAMTVGRLLAGRMGRIAYTTDPSTYPW